MFHYLYLVAYPAEADLAIKAHQPAIDKSQKLKKEEHVVYTMLAPRVYKKRNISEKQHLTMLWIQSWDAVVGKVVETIC